MTVLLQVYVMPGMLWPVHVYWAAILLVLTTRSAPDAISVDAMIRGIYRVGMGAPLLTGMMGIAIAREDGRKAPLLVSFHPILQMLA